MPSHAADPQLDDLGSVSAGEVALIGRIEAELKPETSLGSVLARRVGQHSVRLERSAKQERASLDERVRHAADRFDEARLAEVDRLMSWIASEPGTHARALRSSPEGVDRMVGAWRAIRADLHVASEERWTFTHQQLAENLMGRRVEDLPMSRVHALSQAIWNNAKFLEPAEREGRDSKAVRAFSRLELDSLIADQIRELEDHRGTLDFDRIALDRAGAADRALHDPSPAAVLARKQEAAAERGLYRALKEFRQVEADHRAALEATAGVAPVPDPRPRAEAPPARPVEGELASFGRQGSPAPASPQPRPFAPASRPGDGPMSITSVGVGPG